jgi:RecA-family ATPase
VGGSIEARAAARLRAGLLKGHEITHLKNPAPLISDVLDLDSVAVLFGPSGGGKSLIALDWALHVASGRSWWGRRTAQGTVLYVVAEGARGTKFRYEAWCEYHDIPEVNDIYWLTVPANLLISGEREALFGLVEEINPTLTVLDTLARHIPGGDENSFETMSVLVESLDAIKRVTGGTSVGVHHAGKDEEKGSRGHSSLKGALDVELSLRTRRIDKVMHCDIYAEKMKDHEDHRVLYSAHMEKVGTSLVPVMADGLPLRSTERQALACLNGHYTSHTDWLKASGLARTTFGRAHARLRELDLVEGDSTHGWRVKT